LILIFKSESWVQPREKINLGPVYDLEKY